MQVIDDGQGLVPGVPGGVVIAGGLVGVAELVEGVGFFVAAPALAEQVECLAVAPDGLPLVAEVLVGVAETGKYIGFPSLVAEVGLSPRRTHRRIPQPHGRARLAAQPPSRPFRRAHD